MARQAYSSAGPTGVEVPGGESAVTNKSKLVSVGFVEHRTKSPRRERAAAPILAV